MSIKAPGQARIAAEGSRASDLHEIKIGFRKRWIGFPKAFISTEIGQARVHPNSGPCTDDQRVSVGYDLCRLLNLNLKGFHAIARLPMGYKPLTALLAIRKGLPVCRNSEQFQLPPSLDVGRPVRASL